MLAAREIPPQSEMRLVLWGSLILAALGALCALRILLISPSVRRIHIFFHLFGVYDLPGSLLCAAILLLSVFVRPRGSPPLGLLDGLDRGRYFLAAILAGLLAVGTLTVYHNYPLCVDEFAQLFQARIFARGRVSTMYPVEIAGRLLPVPYSPFFIVSRQTGEVVSGYWPGLSLLQAPFVLLGAPWLLNPLLTAGTLLLIRHLAAQLYPNTAAPAWAMLFALASPAFIVNGLSYYGMPAQLFFNLLFTVLILKRTPAALVAAGVCGSLALVQTVPVPHVLYAIPWILWAVLRRGGWRSFLYLGAGYLPLSLLLGLGWAVFRVDVATQGAFGARTVYERPGRWLSILDLSVFIHTVYYRLLAFLKLAAWAVPGLVVLSIVGARHAWADRRVRTLAASALVTFGAYLLLRPLQGHGWGYRYFHGAWGVLPLLAGGFMAARAGGHLGDGYTPLVRLVAASAVLSLVLLNGLRLYEVHAFIDRHLDQLPPLDPNRTQVCFIRGDGYYTTDLVQNDPFLRQNVLFVRSPGVNQEASFMQEHFPQAVPRSDTPKEAVWLLGSPPLFGGLGRGSWRGGKRVPPGADTGRDAHTIRTRGGLTR
jgi:hypothetical protein